MGLIKQTPLAEDCQLLCCSQNAVSAPKQWFAGLALSIIHVCNQTHLPWALSCAGKGSAEPELQVQK